MYNHITRGSHDPESLTWYVAFIKLLHVLNIDLSGLKLNYILVYF